MSRLTPLSVSVKWPEQQLNLAYLLEDFNIVSNEHGFAWADFFYRGNIREFMSLTRRSRADVVVAYGPQPVWEGKLAIKEHDEGQIKLTALGPWASLSRFPMFELHVDRSLERWKAMRFDTNIVNEAYEIDEENRIYAAPRQDEDYDNTRKFGFRYRVPDDSNNKIVRVEMDYEIRGGSTWRLEVKSQSGALEASANAATPTPTSGTFTLNPLSLTTGNALTIEYFYNSGTSTTYTQETGDHYCKITSIRVVYVNQATITASDIASNMLTRANAAGLDISADDQLIEAQTDDIYQFTEEDISYADAFIKLAGLADSDLSADDYQVAVFEDQKLIFKKKSSSPVFYEADVERFKIRQDASNVINKAYTLGHYREINWRRVRGDIQQDDESITRFGVQGGFLDAEVLSLTTRNEMAAALVAANKDGEPEIEIELSNIYYSGGTSQINPALIRPGSFIKLRGMPLGLSESLGTVTELEVKETYIRPNGTDLMLVRPQQSLQNQVGKVI